MLDIFLNLPMIVSFFSHVKLLVRSVDRSIDFYGKLLGFRTIVQYRTATGLIVHVSPDGDYPGLELWEEDRPAHNYGNDFHFALEVDDVSAWVDFLRGKGVEVKREPFRIGKETIAFVSDPDGYMVELIHMDRSYSLRLRRPAIVPSDSQNDRV